MTPSLLATRTDLLHTVQRLFTPKRVVELGVFKGAFSREILAILRPAEFYMIDLWRGIVECGDKDGLHVVKEDLSKVYREILDEFRSTHETTIRVMRTDTLTGMELFSKAHPVDFVYVDADHHYESVLADLHVCAAGGTMAIGGHDYCPMFEGTVRAVDEFCALRGWTMSHLTRDGCPSYLLLPGRAL